MLYSKCISLKVRTLWIKLLIETLQLQNLHLKLALYLGLLKQTYNGCDMDWYEKTVMWTHWDILQTLQIWIAHNAVQSIFSAVLSKRTYCNFTNSPRVRRSWMSVDESTGVTPFYFFHPSLCKEKRDLDSRPRSSQLLQHSTLTHRPWQQPCFSLLHHSPWVLVRTTNKVGFLSKKTLRSHHGLGVLVFSWPVSFNLANLFLKASGINLV